jgi:hypothetical protein
MAKPPRPEPKFFLVDELYALGIQHYYSTWFRDASSYPAAGEKSTNYLESPTAAERIHAHLPEVKLVFILREPARRAYSNWMWSVMNGLETDDFETAIAKEDERERHVQARLKYARPHAYFSRGLYADLLRPYLNRFPRQQLLCLKFDEIVRHPCELAGPAAWFYWSASSSHTTPTDWMSSILPRKRDEVIPQDAMNRLRQRLYRLDSRACRRWSDPSSPNGKTCDSGFESPAARPDPDARSTTKARGWRRTKAP